MTEVANGFSKRDRTKTKYPFNRCIFAHCLSFIAENNYE